MFIFMAKKQYEEQDFNFNFFFGLDLLIHYLNSISEFKYILGVMKYQGDNCPNIITHNYY